MVAALIMGAVIKPHPPFVKQKPRHSGMLDSGVLGPE
jgi:hypothetical protein